MPTRFVVERFVSVMPLPMKFEAITVREGRVVCEQGALTERLVSEILPVILVPAGGLL